jgi:murein peptide amidase A
MLDAVRSRPLKHALTPGSARVVPIGLALAVTVALGPAMGAGPQASLRARIGHSVQGRTLRAVNAGARSRPTVVLVVGCIHGNECAGVAIVRALRRRSPSEFELWLVRDLNPDGSRAGTRQNARGVDLNRNFPAGWRRSGRPWDTYHSGPRPWSEPETRAARSFILKRRPDITIWYHQHMALVVRTTRHVRVQRRYARLVGLPLTRLDRLPGTATRWQNRRFPGHSAFVVELPAGALTRRAAQRHARAVLRVARLWRRRAAR